MYLFRRLILFLIPTLFITSLCFAEFRVVDEEGTTVFQAGGITSQFKIPNGTTPPTTAEVGQLFMDTDATTGRQLYGYESTNTWVLQGDGNSGGSPTWGTIVGTLSSQTDLNSALAGKAASLGADDNYVTDAEKVVIGNTSGTNTGDNTVATTGDSATSFFSSGAVEVAVGGTGVSTFGDAGVLVGNGTGAVQVTTAGTSGQVFTSNGAGVDPTFQTAAGGNDPRVIMDALTTDEQFNVTASTTLVEITNLSQTLATGTYTFRYDIIYRSNNLTEGIRYAVNYTGTSGAFVFNWRWADLAATASTAVPDQDDVDAAGNVLGNFQSRAKSTTTRGVTLSVDTANADMYIVIEGVFVATGAGDLELWTANETTTAGYTNSTMIGTSLVIHKTK